MINEFLQEDLTQRGNVETVVLCGSYATGRASTQSDIDLCYIGDFSAFHRESIVSKGREFQLMIAPWSWYKHVILEYEQEGTNIGTITVMLATGVCLIGDNDKWQTMRAQAESLYHKGPKAPSVEEVRKIRVRITDLWEDFCDAKTELDRKWLATETLQKCVEAFFFLRNWWAVKPKYQMEDLKARDPIMGDLLIRCIESLGSKEGLNSICEYVLEPVGGWMKESWKS
nr:nucleotidyltransferase domain-containing protein [Paenibacillus artemisiicola]